jgi:hypothetical protein
MKKISSMKFLAAVGIVSSATVMQIRAHVASPEAAPTEAHTAMPTCGSAHDGVTPASCDQMRSERQVERHQQPPAARQLWV